MGRKIAVVSGKGGVGKTTITFGLGLSLAKMGKSVCLIDLDIGLNNLDMLFGAQDKIMFDLADCIDGKCRIKQALVRHEKQENLYVLSSSKSDVFTEISELKLNLLLSKLASVFDFVLIDCPAGINRNVYLGLKSSNEALLVVTPHIASISDADKVLSVIKGFDLNFSGVIVNRVRGDMLAKGESLSHKQIAYLLKSEVVGVLPESDQINVQSGNLEYKSINKDEILLAFDMLATNIESGRKQIFDCQKQYRGFLGMIRRNIKRSV
ncbi:MAG: septum site-determining protein MinD [Clostridia bacterium]|nr:septum site-determining protein MinD [Clostridia bacterium]